ncbi:hypothetical protein CMV_028142 [Castanea mollissima]|uniref:Uncharacterized protein n=1 Tax=Castanea mollissima TaxID=60419 RepID=A0A8J4V8Q0_9ROSI|nr:hypothetical protein CMV_028142 [Castanea mollissima]
MGQQWRLGTWGLGWQRVEKDRWSELGSLAGEMEEERTMSLGTKRELLADSNGKAKKSGRFHVLLTDPCPATANMMEHIVGSSMFGDLNIYSVVSMFSCTPVGSIEIEAGSGGSKREELERVEG